MPTQDWASLQDVFYRKSDIYTLSSWGVNTLRGQRVAIGRNGGFVAICRDQNSLLPIGSGGTRMKIAIYTAAGQMFESLPVSKLLKWMSLNASELTMMHRL